MLGGRGHISLQLANCFVVKEREEVLTGKVTNLRYKWHFATYQHCWNNLHRGKGRASSLNTALQEKVLRRQWPVCHFVCLLIAPIEGVLWTISNWTFVPHLNDNSSQQITRSIYFQQITVHFISVIIAYTQILPFTQVYTQVYQYKYCKQHIALTLAHNLHL